LVIQQHPHKVIVFASEQALELLSKNQHWNDDGTFRTSPALFSQSYYIHIWNEFSMKPIVHSCCEEKSENVIMNYFNHYIYATKKYRIKSIINLNRF